QNAQSQGDRRAWRERRARLDHVERSATAGEVGGVRAENLVSLRRLRPQRPGPTEQARLRNRVVERRERDHAPELIGPTTGWDVLEVTAGASVALYEDVAAEQDRRQHQLSDRWLGVDLLGDHRAEHPRALRVADEHETAAMVVVLQVVRERVLDIRD